MRLSGSRLLTASWAWLLSVLLLIHIRADAARVYYVNQPENGFGSINAVDPNGANHSTLYTTTTVTDLRGIAVDPATASLYFAYADSDPSTLARSQVSIRRLATAGGTPSVVTNLPDGTFATDVEWDEINGRIYFAQTSDGLLRRIKPDGSGLQTVITTTGDGQGPYFFGLDLVSNLAYWGIATVPNQTNTAFSRGSLTTGVIDPEFTLVTPSRTRDIAIDATLPGGQVYWCDRQNGTVYQRGVAGGTVVVARSGLNAPHGLALDIEAGKGYVADTGKRGNGFQPSAHRVVRFNLDGSGDLEFLSPVDGLAEPWDVTIDLSTVNYADWKRRFFPANASQTAPEDDPDGDGSPNYAEYALFTHPARPDADNHPGRVENKQFRYPRRNVTDVPVRVEVSTDLKTWHWNGDSAGAVWTKEVSVSNRDIDSVWVTVALAPLLEVEPQVYFRVRAQQLVSGSSPLTSPFKRVIKKARRR